MYVTCYFARAIMAYMASEDGDSSRPLVKSSFTIKKITRKNWERSHVLGGPPTNFKILPQKGKMVEKMEISRVVE